MDILKRIDHVQQFCKFYSDGAYSVEKEKWNYHVTPEFIEDIRQYIESLQLKLMHLQKQQAEPVASIYVNLVGDREFDDWQVDLPVGNNYLYTSPQRPWVGLTDEEIKEIHNASVGKDVGFATGLTEAKLKEKNTT